MELPVDDFYSGRTKCKVCSSIENKQWREDNAAHLAQYNLDNKDKHSASTQKWYENNKEQASEDNIRRASERRKVDPAFAMRLDVSRAISAGLKSAGSTKQRKSCLDFLGYSMEELKAHLERQFEPWMNWGNRGYYTRSSWDDNDQATWKWQIDHIIPHSTFHYTSMEDEAFKQCWALENLRPLSAKQNLLDGATKIRHKK